MPKLVLLLICLVTSSFLRAQSIERSLIGSTGASFTNPSVSMDFSVAEAVIETVESSGIMVTQGFQQGSRIPTDVRQLMVRSIKFYPNPVLQNLYIESNRNESLGIKILDITGREVYSTSLGDQYYLDLGFLPAGTYQVIAISPTNKPEIITIQKI